MVQWFPYFLEFKSEFCNKEFLTPEFLTLYNCLFFFFSQWVQVKYQTGTEDASKRMVVTPSLGFNYRLLLPESVLSQPLPQVTHPMDPAEAGGRRPNSSSSHTSPQTSAMTETYTYTNSHLQTHGQHSLFIKSTVILQTHCAFYTSMLMSSALTVLLKIGSFPWS